MARCGQYPPADHRQPYCPVCHALERIDTNDDHQWDIATTAVFDRCDRIKHAHRAYRGGRR